MEGAGEARLFTKRVLAYEGLHPLLQPTSPAARKSRLGLLQPTPPPQRPQHASRGEDEGRPSLAGASIFSHPLTNHPPPCMGIKPPPCLPSCAHHAEVHVGSVQLQVDLSVNRRFTILVVVLAHLGRRRSHGCGRWWLCCSADARRLAGPSGGVFRPITVEAGTSSAGSHRTL